MIYNKYCETLTGYKRNKTRVVNIGDVPCGGNNPIRIQSMTVSDTMDTKASVAECIRIIESGCDYVRLTAPSIREAENLREIKKQLRNSGFNTPLIADIHFTPNAAEAAARIVEKVRVNPGNYVDRKKFQLLEYSDSDYNEELERIHQRFTPLVNICKENGTAMRIGTNHGSLSDRILSRYGDTPLGMVESALEFLRICRDSNYHQIVLSMKSSNPLVMVQAYRLLVNRMNVENMDYPLHLGVTEAGEGEEGRIKSALGIGTLLEDGLGDTIRVSLTEPPEYEAIAAKTILSRYTDRPDTIFDPNKDADREINEKEIGFQGDPFAYKKRKTASVKNIGGDNVPVVIADLYSSTAILQKSTESYSKLAEIGYKYEPELDKWSISDTAVDYLYVGKTDLEINITPQLGIIIDSDGWIKNSEKNHYYPLFFNIDEYLKSYKKSENLNFVLVNVDDITEQDSLAKLTEREKTVLILNCSDITGYKEFRNMMFKISKMELNTPVIFKKVSLDAELSNFQIHTAIDAGGLFLDGFGDGIWLSPVDESRVSVVFSVLQAARVRISKAEYISCPSCGRTQFDLQETSAMIRSRTDHLKGIKIGIMGCIVNGPGEMADADYGYVGTGQGKISLYRQQEVVKKNIESENAVDELIELIKEDGKWVSP